MGDMTVLNYLVGGEQKYKRNCDFHRSSPGYLDCNPLVEPECGPFSGLSSVDAGDESMEMNENSTVGVRNQEGKTFDFNLSRDSDLCTDVPTDSLTPDQIYKQDEDGDTLLHTAIILKRTALALDFIKEAPTVKVVSIKNKMHQSALHLALLTDQVSVARKLVACGVNVTERYNQNTPLHMACSRGNFDMAKAFLEPVQYQETLDLKFMTPYQKIPQGFDTRNGNGLTPLHVAASLGYKDIVSLLVQKGADVNAGEGKTGRTVLHNASVKGDVNMVKALIAMDDCDVNARAMDDLTPFDFARFGKQVEIQILLARVGAGVGTGE